MKRLFSFILIAGLLLSPILGWSADKKISELDLKATPTVADAVPIVNAADLTKTYRALLGAMPLSGNDELKALGTGPLWNATGTATVRVGVAGTDYQAARTTIYNLTTSPQAVALPASGADVTIVIGSNGTGTNTGLQNDMVFSAPSGGVAGQKLIYAILSDGSARALNFTNAIFVPVGVVKPTTTVASKWTYVNCIYNAVTSKLDVLGVSQEQ
jgi:hypothetical protein